MEKSIIKQETLGKIQTCIKDSVKPTFANFVTGRKHADVISYQNLLCETLNNINCGCWKTEQGFNDWKDAIDIRGECDGVPVIIEIDTMRADQLAKKMISRFSGFLHQPIVYIAICYPGTDKMKRGECVKYFEYGRMVLTGINHESIFLGCIIEDNLAVTFNPEK